MQCKRYAPRLVSYGHACVTPTSGISNSMTFPYSYLFGYPGPRFFFATLSPSRGGKSRKTCGTRILLALVIEEVGRLGRSPSLLRARSILVPQVFLDFPPREGERVAKKNLGPG